MRRLKCYLLLASLSLLVALVSFPMLPKVGLSHPKPFCAIYDANRIEPADWLYDYAEPAFRKILGYAGGDEADIRKTLPQLEVKSINELAKRGCMPDCIQRWFESIAPMHPTSGLDVYLDEDPLARWCYYRFNSLNVKSVHHSLQILSTTHALYLACGKLPQSSSTLFETYRALHDLVRHSEHFYLDDAQEALALARRAKAETEGWLPGEGITGVSLYRKIRPRAILDRIGPEEHFWVVRFGRHHEGDPDGFYRTTQEYWIDARSGLTRAIFLPLPGPYRESTFKDAITPGYSLDVFRALGSDITRAAACDIRTLLGLREFRFAPQSVSLKPFACSDYLSFIASEDFVDLLQRRSYDPRLSDKDNCDRELSRQISKLPPLARELLAELGQCRTSSLIRLIMIIASDTLLSEHQGILLRWMTQGAATVYLIRMGRDVPGFAQYGDLVYVAHQAYGPVPYPSTSTLGPVGYAPFHCRTIWVNARTGAFFSVVAADPHDRVERIVLPAKSQSPWEIYANKIPRFRIE